MGKLGTKKGRKWRAGGREEERGKRRREEGREEIFIKVLFTRRLNIQLGFNPGYHFTALV